MTYIATVRADGSILLGSQAADAGYRPGTMVVVSVNSSGSLFVAIDTSLPLIDASFRALSGGAAQLAAGRSRRYDDGG